MKLRIALTLAATFLTAALAFTVLPACSDESVDNDEIVEEMDCDAICGDDCWTRTGGGECRCHDDEGDPPVCPV